MTDAIPTCTAGRFRPADIIIVIIVVGTNPERLNDRTNARASFFFHFWPVVHYFFW